MQNLSYINIPSRPVFGVEPSGYKHVALGLIFLKYISEAFQAMHDRLAEDKYSDPEDPEEYLAANVFWGKFQLKMV